MELFLGQFGISVRTPAGLWRRMWPLFRRGLFGAMRTTVDWSLRTPTTPIRVRRRSMLEVDLGGFGAKVCAVCLVGLLIAWALAPAAEDIMAAATTTTTTVVVGV